MRVISSTWAICLASTAAFALGLEVSQDGTCSNGVTCLGSMWGNCCSKSGFCGATKDYCLSGCQIQYGFCENTQGKVSPNGLCGGREGFTCKDSNFGDCCSQYNYCGQSSDYCSAGCQSGFGSCFLQNSTTVMASTTTAKVKRDESASTAIAFTTASALPICPAANNTVITTKCGAQYQIECGVDHYGGDINWSENGVWVPTIQDCVAYCANWTGVTNCTSVSWRHREGGVKGPCYLKDSYSGQNNYGSDHDSARLIKNCTTSSSASSATLSSSARPATSVTPTIVSPSQCSGSIAPYTPTAATAPCIPCDGQSGSLPYCGADATTDYYKFTPKTCRTVYYNFDITNTTVAPDGIERIGLLVNGQMPGPKIEANWGDTIVVTVSNKMQDNGTSIHFHGIRQLNNSEFDGVPAITQCPIAPGESFTYSFTASHYGTSWYHSHYAIQAWEGVFGPMVIHGPTTRNYDVDAGVLMLNDWSHDTVDSRYTTAESVLVGGPQVMDNGLINGKNTWGVDGTSNQTGERYELPTQFEPGKTYLLALVNSAIQSTYKFYIDNHTMTVISADFTPIVPYETNILNINIGQRYMVLVKANQTPGNYWLRADNQNACAATKQATDIKGILRYASSSNKTATPTTTGYDYTTECVDEPAASLCPINALSAGHEDDEFTYDVLVRNNGRNVFKWYLSGTTFYSNYSDPTLLSVLNNNGNLPTYSGNLILDLPKLGEWVYIIIESVIPLPHPIHLHGHDFFVLGSGSGSYSAGSSSLNINNPPRRDTVLMPAAGYVVIGFETDNPGTWLMHCHIGWHTSMGFALQLAEGKTLIGDTVKDYCSIQGTCDSWNKWTSSRGFEQHDSGV